MAASPARGSLPGQSKGARALSHSSLTPFRLWATLGLIALLLFVANLLFAQGDPPSSPSAISAAARNIEFDPATLLSAVAIVLGFTLLNACLALAEVALITVRKTRLRQLVEEGNRSAQLVEQMLANPTRLLATIQTGMTLLSTVSVMVAAVATVPPLAAWIVTQSPRVPVLAADVIALLLVALPVATLALIVGEIAPKSLAARHSERLALIVVYPTWVLQGLLTIPVAFLTFLANMIVRPFGGTASFIQPAVNEEELKMLVEASEEQGVLEEAETEMIHSILGFGETVVRKVMTPRIDMTAIRVDAPMTELICLIYESGHSRIPVYEGDLDNIIGIVHAKDLLALPVSDRDETPIRSMMRPAYIIPETKKVDELLAEFRRSKQQLAVVSDEYGITSGIVTIEDLLEEIVGEIQDEYDEEETQVQVIDSRTTILDGRMSISDVNETMGLELPEDESDTIGGFVFGLLGHQAVAGERAAWDGVEFTVEATDGRRIQKVRIVKSHRPAPRAETTDEEAVATQS